MAISELYTPPSSNFSEQIWVQKCLLNKLYWRSNVKKNLFCTLYRTLKLAIFHSYMNWKCQIFIQNAELLTPVTQNWHNFFRRIIEMAENRRKQQKSMSLSLTSETAVEYTIWPTNDTYIITVCWVMKNRERLPAVLVKMRSAFCLSRYPPFCRKARQLCFSIAIFKNSAYQDGLFAICSLRLLLVH